MAEDFSKSRGVAPSPADHRSAGPRAPAWRPGKTGSPLTGGDRPDSRGSAPPPPVRGYPAAVSGALGFPAGLAPLTQLMPPWPAGRPPLTYLLPGHPAAETELQQLERERLLAQHRQQQQQQQSASRDAASREAAEKQQREAERLRQEEERKKQQQAVSQHFAESMRRMHQKSRLGSGAPSGGGGVGLHPAGGAGRYPDPRGPADISSQSERVIRDSIHRLYQSTEPEPPPPPPPHAPQPPRPPYAPDFMAYYDRLNVQQAHAAKAGGAAATAAERRSPYLPHPPGQSVYKPQPPLGRSPAPPEARLPLPPPQRTAPPAHGGDRSGSPYLPPGPVQPVPHRPAYSPPAGTHLSVVGAGLPPPAHTNHVRRTTTPPGHHQTLDLSVSSRSPVVAAGTAAVIASPKRPASTPLLNLGVSPAKRSCPEPLLSVDEPISLVSSAAKQITTVSNTAVTAAMEAVSVTVSANRESWSTPPPASSTVTPPTTSTTSASAPASGTSSPAPAEPPAVTVKQEPSSDVRSYPHKGKKAWLLRHVGGGHDSSSSTAVPVTTPSVSVSSVTTGNVNGTNTEAGLSNGSGVASPASAVKVEKPSIPPEAATVALTAARKTPSPSAPVTELPTAADTAIKSEPKLEVKVKPLVAADVAVNGDGESDSSAGSLPNKRKTTPLRKSRTKKSEILAREAKKAKTSEGSDSDSEKGSEDETRRIDNKFAKKRGRKTKEKPTKQAKRSLPAAKQPSPSVEKKETPPKKTEAIKRQSISSLKKSGVSFLQDLFCCNLSSKLPKCRECRITQTQRNKKLSNIYCRFTAFRRLRYTKSGMLTVAGFCDPEQDADEDDKRLWMPADADCDDNSDSSPSSAAWLQPDAARALLSQAGPQFCELTGDEQEAARCHLNGDTTVAWKRVVQGCREMCDVCETTLFNVHWVCGKCGFAVCIDCYRGRKEGTARTVSEPGRDRDKFQWMLCSSRQPHEQQRLMLTQIVAGDALDSLSKQLHDARLAAGLPLNCQCEAARRLQPAGDPAEFPNGTRTKLEDYRPGEVGDSQGSPLTWLADVALSDSKKNSDVSNSESESDTERTDGDHSTLRKLLIRTGDPDDKTAKKDRQKKPSPAGAALATLDAVLDKVSSQAGEPVPPPDPARQLKHYTRPRPRRGGPRDRALPRVMTLADSQRLYPGVRHGWLCEGRLLLLQEEAVPAAVRLFRDQWARGQPVLFSGVGNALDKNMWTPEAFTRDFGDERAELLDASGAEVADHTHRQFWEGFSDVEKRPRDEDGRRMTLTLRDWPPGEDFPDVMPARFNDLTTALPFAEYTRRDGIINLASCLPDTFVRPDLGPRLTIGFGGEGESRGAVTYLQQEVADSISIMAHVCKAEGEKDAESRLKEALEEAGCDALTLRRASEEVPGAVWHIYQASDADCIRDLLNKVSGERGSPVEARSDPLRQPSSWYLDSTLRRRLRDEYGVQGYTLVQCAGDAVLLPAGAPHQVQHLHSCVRVAEEFVSPENVGNSFDVTQHLRALSQPGDSHEDKLQIKNIVYHAVKDAVGCLLRARRAGKAPATAASSPAESA